MPPRARTAKTDEEKAALAEENAEAIEAYKIDPQDSLVTKLSKIASRIGNRKAEKHGGVTFAYHKAADVYGWWRPWLNEQSILLVPRIVSWTVQELRLPRSGGGERVTFRMDAEVEFTVIDGITGQQFVGSVLAQGEDPSDKAAGKVMTYAEKIFLLGMGMNGAEADNEAFSDDMRDRPVQVGSSNIEGVARGGRQENATDAQVLRIRQLARDLHIDARGIARVVKNVLNDDIELPEEGADDPGPVVLAYLGQQKADDLGKLISRLEEAKKRGEEPRATDPTSVGAETSTSTSSDSTPTNSNSSSTTSPEPSPEATPSPTTTEPDMRDAAAAVFGADLGGDEPA